MLAKFRERYENLALSFQTNKGTQVAFYLPPLESPHDPPKQLAVLYPGIETPTLHWLQFIDLSDDPGTGYLLLEYPGRGFSEGNMHPEELHENTDGALTALAEHFEVDSIEAEISLLGHSFGTGTALQFAARCSPSRVVLVAPYNDLKNAVSRQLGYLIATLMPAQIDNRSHIKTVLNQSPLVELIIIHGMDDTSLPVEMGRELHAINPNRIILHEIPGASHVDILTSHRDLIFQTLLFGKTEENGAE